MSHHPSVAPVISAFAAVVCTAAAISAQQIQAAAVPAPIRDAWASDHAGAVRWERGPGAAYEAWFTAHGVRTVIRYNGTGQIDETRTVMGSFDLPDPVRATILRTLRGYHILEVWRIARTGHADEYMIECDNIKRALLIRYDAAGHEITRSVGPATHVAH